MVKKLQAPRNPSRSSARLLRSPYVFSSLRVSHDVVSFRNRATSMVYSLPLKNGSRDGVNHQKSVFNGSQQEIRSSLVLQKHLCPFEEEKISKVLASHASLHHSELCRIRLFISQASGVEGLRIASVTQCRFDCSLSTMVAFPSIKSRCSRSSSVRRVFEVEPPEMS